MTEGIGTASFPYVQKTALHTGPGVPCGPCGPRVLWDPIEHEDTGCLQVFSLLTPFPQRKSRSKPSHSKTSFPQLVPPSNAPLSGLMFFFF